ncbi:oxygen-independent coproporphyrinogen III oxidase [Arenimonas sp. MALMAid1274]|uniref:oxygen-independent coproporphyrinogen III oxidase n=1 Tax=Arenimonas sp. MALMAid1274 TaxID=3411630 RepID=UPI003BA12CBF
MAAIPPFDPDLLRRHDRPGPRYTSYPTAPQFGAGFGPAEFTRAAQCSNQDPIPRPLSLYVHLPFCASPCYYCGCNRVITRDPGRAAPYLARLGAEAARVGALFDRDREVVQLHLGGGTPNFVSSREIGELMEELASRFRFSQSPSRDFSIEIDPRAIQPGDIEALAFMGFNRASLGVQDFDPVVQQAVNRLQSVEETNAVITACRRRGFQSVNIDLIYGLPRQNLEGFARTLDTVIAQRPDRLAIYSYAHMPSLFKPQRQIDESQLPDPEAKLGLLRLAIEALSAAGYRHVGMDHFALPQDELSLAQERGDLHRNFMGYTTHADCDLIGLGVSAISHVGDTYSQNPRELKAWEAAIDAGQLPTWRGLVLDADDLLRADLIQQLMCRGEVDIATLEERHGITFAAYFAPDLKRLSALVADGLAWQQPGAFGATPRGRMLLRVIAACFDRYLHAALPVAQARAV